MKIFLTGGTGFIGSHFINHAHRAGHRMVALRRAGSVPRVPLDEEPEWIEGLLDADYRSAMAGCDVFAHLAAHTPNPPYDTLERCLYWNVTASLQLAEQARGVGIRRFLVTGTCFEYGRSAERYQFIPVTAPLEPVLSYPTSKAAASVAFLGFAAIYGVQLSLYRLFQVYGEGELASRLWPSLQRAALAGEDFPMTLGEQVRDFIHVGDVAARLVAGLEFAGVEPGRPVVRHIGTGKPQTLLEFAQAWWRKWGATGRLIPGQVAYRPNEVMRYVPEIT